jgi:hypothetical protein
METTRSHVGHVGHVGRLRPLAGWRCQGTLRLDLVPHLARRGVIGFPSLIKITK